MTGRAHADAVLALLEAAVTTFDSQVEGAPPDRYVVFYPGPGLAQRDRMTPSSSKLDAEFQVTAVGLSREQAQWAADAGRDAVLDVRPVVAGRACSPIRQTVARPLARDDDVTPPLFYVVALYAFTSVPA